MVPIVEIACLVMGRLDHKRVVKSRVRWREAGVDGCTPLPLHGYAGHRGAERTAPGYRTDTAWQTRRQREGHTREENFITPGNRNDCRPGIAVERSGGAGDVRTENNFSVRNQYCEWLSAGREGDRRAGEAYRRAALRYPARCKIGVEPDGVACRNPRAVEVRRNG